MSHNKGDMLEHLRQKKTKICRRFGGARGYPARARPLPITTPHAKDAVYPTYSLLYDRRVIQLVQFDIFEHLLWTVWESCSVSVALNAGLVLCICCRE